MQTQRVKLLLDKEWTLEELALVSKNYNQLYAFAYSLAPDISDSRQQEVMTAYASFPWRGGFSTVSFFHHVFSRIPSGDQPQVTRITYASPGFIELAALATACLLVAQIVTSVAKAIRTTNDTYDHIQKGMQERRLSKLRANLEELKLQKQIHDFCDQSSDQLTRAMGFSQSANAALDQRTNGNKLMKLKLLMSVYRRVRPLAEKQAQGKLRVDPPSPPPPPPPSPPPPPPPARDPLV